MVALTPLLGIVVFSAALIAAIGVSVAILLFKSARRTDWEEQAKVIFWDEDR